MRKRSAMFWVASVLAITAIGLSGCSAEPMASQGRVMFSDGEPVQSGSVEFRSLSSGDRYASRIGEGGRFELADDDGRVGIPAGEYEVVVVQIVLTEDLAAKDHAHGTSVPRRYADYYTSGLRAVIQQPPQDEIVITIEADQASQDGRKT